LGHYFRKALPVWLKGLESEMHIRAVYRAVIHVMDKNSAMIKIATSGIYNLFVNGIFAAYGPARAGQNHFRMDEIPLTEFLREGENLIAVEVAGYNVNSYCMRYFFTCLM
jgi:alpha-L-rhamnosidase